MGAVTGDLSGTDGAGVRQTLDPGKEHESQKVLRTCFCSHAIWYLHLFYFLHSSPNLVCSTFWTFIFSPLLLSSDCTAAVILLNL